MRLCYNSSISAHTHLEAVPRAVIQACKMPLKKTAGFLRVITKYMILSVPQAWMMRPRMTVNMYRPSCEAVWDRLSILRICPAIRNMMPMGEYLQNGEVEKTIKI